MKDEPPAPRARQDFRAKAARDCRGAGQVIQYGWTWRPGHVAQGGAMRKICFLAIVLSALSHPHPGLAQAGPPGGRETITLYSALKYQNSRPQQCLSFTAGRLVPRRGGGWDLCYGYIYAGKDLDWFEVLGSEDSRTVLKDLGRINWGATFKLSVLEPLPKLKEGERRQITIDTSGRNGADGAPGAARAGAPGTNENWMEQIWPNLTIPLETVKNPPHRKRLGNQPALAKAVPGHIYEIHVVNSRDDFYALFRVDSLTRGDNCTISWERVPTPRR